MANPEHMAILNRGVPYWNMWRFKNHELEPDLSAAKAMVSNLSGALLFRTDLHATNFFRADLHGADLHEANLTDANLRDADLRRVNLSKANLRNADLRWTVFREVDLSEADFTDVRLGYTVFADVDMSGVKGLDSVRHDAPSSIAIDTIYHSRGNIPESFLRGAGVSDDLIAYVKSRSRQALETYCYFIIYSPEDETFAQRLYADLQSSGIRCWLAPDGIRIDSYTGVADRVIFIFSRYSVQSKRIVREVTGAASDERLHSRTIRFAISLDDSVLETDQEWAAEFRRSVTISDFLQWEDNEFYQRALAELMGKLRS